MILKLKNLGHKVSHLPTLNVEKTKYEKINYSEYSGIIFTSANAIKFLDHTEISKNINCFCVGKMTEKKARSLGFQNTISAEGNVSNLKEINLQTQDLINKQNLINKQSKEYQLIWINFYLKRDLMLKES